MSEVVRALDQRLTLRFDAPASGVWNMERDAVLLDECARGDSAGAVRLYGFDPPCLTLGRMQPESDVDAQACARAGVDVVRRPSGGRAVLHDQGVTYAVVCHVDDDAFGGDVLTSCARIHSVIASGLARLGVLTRANAAPRDLRAHGRRLAGSADCFAQPAAQELLDAQGLKLVGSAQARRGAALLQHGSVPLEAPRAHAFLRGARSAPAASPGIRVLAGRQVGFAELAAGLIDAFRDTLGARLTSA